MDTKSNSDTKKTPEIINIGTKDEPMFIFTGEGNSGKSCYSEMMKMFAEFRKKHK